MPKAQTYSLKGTKLEAVNLPSEFAVKENLELLAQAIRVYEERSHVGMAKAQTRAEVNRTTKKVYKQKGTGGARHGSRSAPIYVGGGVAHGPRPLRRELSLSKKIAKLALYQALTMKLANKEVFMVGGIEKLAKTKEASIFINKLVEAESLKSKRFTFVLSEKAQSISKCLKNVEGVRVAAYKGLNAFNVLLGGVLIFDESVFAKTEAKKEVKVEIKKEKAEVKVKKEAKKVRKAAK